MAEQKRILMVSHGHPDIARGGGEVSAYELHQAINNTPDWKSVFLARHDDLDRVHGGTPFSGTGRPGEILFYSKMPDWFRFSQPDKAKVWRDFREALRVSKPDIVHFHHYVHLGLELIREVKNFDPTIRIVMTLHEMFAMCHNHGQMIKKTDGALCHRATQDACSKCFPQHTPQDFFLREQFIKSYFSLIDEFITPSEFVAQRYIDWGISPDRITVIDNLLPRIDDGGVGAILQRTHINRKIHLGFFGQINEFKGVDILLDAVAQLSEDTRQKIQVSINGSGLDKQPGKFRRHLNTKRRAVADCVRFAGAYQRNELASLMSATDWIVVPSRWWENSPVVILEARKFGVPVICSDIGGMAEKVENDVTGLHFSVDRPDSLAARIEQVVTDRELQSSMAQAMAATFEPEKSFEQHLHLYSRLASEQVDPPAELRVA